MSTDRSAGNPSAIRPDEALNQRMQHIRRRIIVLSGKGGVGKSTVAANLACTLSRTREVALVDCVDFHGPSVPKLLHLEGSVVQIDHGNLRPVEVNGLKVMSVGFLLPERDSAVIWRGPMKANVIRQFLQDVDWGELDYLLIDSPPGTGDEPLSVVQLAAPLDGAVIVTTPQDVAVADVRRSVTFCRQLNLPVLGIVENMSGFICPHCGERTDIFRSGGGERMAVDMEVPFLGRIPIDPAVGEAGDAGTLATGPAQGTETAKAFGALLQPILALSETETTQAREKSSP